LEGAARDLAVAAGFDLVDAVLDRLAELVGVGLGPAGAGGEIDRYAVEVRALVAGHLAQRLLGLLLLGVAVKVGDAAARLGAAVDREQPAVGALEPLAFGAAVQRMHVDRQRERLAGHHRPQKPAQVGDLGGRVDIDGLLEV
jgi:hypothetical protein